MELKNLLIDDRNKAPGTLIYPLQTMNQIRMYMSSSVSIPQKSDLNSNRVYILLCKHTNIKPGIFIDGTPYRCISNHNTWKKIYRKRMGTHASVLTRSRVFSALRFPGLKPFDIQSKAFMASSTAIVLQESLFRPTLHVRFLEMNVIDLLVSYRIT